MSKTLRRLVVVPFVALSLTLTGCASYLDPLPSEPCTPFGCQQTGNIIQELGGMVLFMGVIIVVLAVIARRFSE